MASREENLRTKDKKQIEKIYKKVKKYVIKVGARIEEKAENVFSQQTLLLDEVSAEEPTGKTVVFFQITSSGFVVARKSGDYVSKMIYTIN